MTNEERKLLFITSSATGLLLSRAGDQSGLCLMAAETMIKAQDAVINATPDDPHMARLAIVNKELEDSFGPATTSPVI